MTAHNLVIVESPAKAKTINKYLGKDYQVIASYGHVRDLPPKDGSVQPDNGFAMEWEMNDRAKKQVNEIVKLAKASDTVYLATDPDREGEAISWHIAEIFRDKKIKAGLKRVAFNEITKKAVQDAFTHARDIDNHLVEAYLARRALDYLVGFTLSPILWRKLPGSRSAGRVQSVALRLVCEREGEIEAFKEEEYWSIEALLKTDKNETFTAKLTQVDGNKLQKMDIHNQAEADALAKRLEDCKTALTVTDVEKKQVRRNPPPPFITSTLQQEASRKLGFSATKTMRTAQKLYEGITLGGETVGLITYMRTDGVTLSG
ncbi:MAG: type I DNA topoisomerase, partial [Alphaproteobacteria bacterium]